MKGACLRTLGLAIVVLALCTAAGASRLPLAYMAEVADAEASSNATTEPLLASPVFPLYDKLTPDNMVSSLQTLFGQLGAGITALEADTPQSWDALLDPYERLGDALNMAWSVVENLQEVKNSDALRGAIAQVQDANVALGNRFSESRPLYDAFAGMQNRTALSEVQERIVEGILLTAEQGGVTLQGAQLDRFNNITLQLSNLSTTFSNNVVDATAAFTKLVNDSAQMAGLPPSFRAQAAQKASDTMNITATPEAGPWLITLDEPSYIAVLTFSANRDLREEVYKAFITRATSGDSDNGPVIESILALRQEQANLTGYANYAEFSLASKMANMTTAMQLLEELRSASFDTAARELKDLQAYAASQNFTQQLLNWDVTYWAQQQQQALFNLTDEEVRPYFVYDNVLQGLFQLGHHLFNVTVEAADGEVPVWDPSVRFFRLYRNGELKGYLYIDPYARPGEKSAGAWMDGIVGESKLLAAPGEALRLPVAIIVTNQSPPVGNETALMTMEEVVTVFHEFGHAMQHTMTMQTDVLVSGISGIEQDAVEQPSQMLERWPYTRNVCFSFARHYQTNESMPEELYSKLLAARNYRSGTDSLRQLFYALMDLRIHAEYAPAAGTTVEQSAVYKDVIAKTSVMPPLPQDRFLNTFTHIFSGGYAAGYYGYKWAQVMSLDGFAAFEEIGLNNTDAIAAEGLKYRNTILADGGGRAPLLVFEDFRGRPPSTKALLRDENLLPAKAPVTAAVAAQSLDL